MISKMVPQPAEGEEPSGFRKFINQIDEFFSNKGISFIFSFSALVLGLFNFFAPDFSAAHSAPVIGATIPALILILDGAVIQPEIIEIINIAQDKKDKYYNFIEKISGFMGLITLVSAFLHIAFYKQILL
jgi:uncharacterized membrane protein HdeD (DUF308 family)